MPKGRFTPRQVHLIRLDAECGMADPRYTSYAEVYEALAGQWQVHPRTIERIYKRQSYKDTPGQSVEIDLDEEDEL